MVAFSRPHTVIGTTVSLVALWVLAVDAAGTPTSAFPLVVALIGALATNVYIVGLNQLTDVDIDRVNKPYLPLAAEDLTLRQGGGLVVAAAAVALATGIAGGAFLLAAFLLGIVVGTLYSVPPMRLKRRPFWAAASVSFVRGVVVNVLVYLHFSRVTQDTARLPARILLLAVVIVVLGLVIAWFKDVPDMEGDRAYGVRTLSLRIGPQRVLTIGLTVWGVCQGLVVLTALVGVGDLHTAALVAGAVALVATAVIAARRVDFDRPRTFVRFYLLIWGIFYAQYGVFAVAGVLA